MAMFGSENLAGLAGGMQGGSMDPLLLEEMMKNMPELKARQRRAEQLRGTQEKFGAMGSEGPNNYTRAQQGGLYPTIQKYHTDYGQIGKAVTGALGGYATGNAAETAQGSADEMLAQQGLGVAQAFGGGNTGGRMNAGTMGGIGPGLSAAQTAPQVGGVIPGAPGQSPGSGPNPIGQMRQNYGMANKGDNALANLSRWFGQ